MFPSKLLVLVFVVKSHTSVQDNDAVLQPQQSSVSLYVNGRKGATVEMKTGHSLTDENIIFVPNVFQTLPLLKFSITWVNRGQCKEA